MKPPAGLMVRVVPDADTLPCPEVTAGVSASVMGLPGKGLVTSDATSTVTGEPSEVSVAGAVVMRGLVDSTILSGSSALTDGFVPSLTVMVILPVVPMEAFAAALTDSVEPDRLASKPSDADPAVKERRSPSGSLVMAARSAVVVPSPGATTICVGVSTGAEFVVDSTTTGSVRVELRASSPVPSATVIVTEVCPRKPAVGVSDTVPPLEPTVAESRPLPVRRVEVSVTVGEVPAREAM